MRDYFLWLAKVLTVLVLIAIIPIFIGAMVAMQDPSSAASITGNKQVAVVELTGAIENTKDVLDQLYKQAADTHVAGIVLRIDSPGGAVGPSQDVYYAVKKLKEKKPIVASMGSVAASGGFYASLGASKVFCQPGTLTGSVGVIMQIPNFTHVADKIGVDMVTIKSGKLKDAGNSFRDMTPEERQYLEATAATVHEQFIQAVAEGRHLDIEKIREFTDGRIIIGSRAKELGLVDEFGDVHDAARAVFEVLGKPLPENEQPNLIYPGEKFGDLKKIFQTISSLPKILSSKGASLDMSM